MRGDGSGYERLKSGTTLEDIIVTAMSFERTAHEFYTNLKTRVGQPMRDLAHEVAEEELSRKADLEKRYYELVYTADL